MSIDISARLIYGLPYSKLREVEDLDGLLDSGELTCASPYYDAPRKYWIVGVELPSDCADEQELAANIREAREVFESRTGGVRGRVLVSLDVV